MSVLSPETALMKAVVEALFAATAVTEIVGERIFDEVPTKSPAPYLSVGPIVSQRTGNADCAPTRTVSFRLFCVTTSPGRLAAWALADRVAQALDGTEPALSGIARYAQELRLTSRVDEAAPGAPMLVWLDFTAILTT